MRRLTAVIVLAGSIALAGSGVLAQEHQPQHPQSGATTKNPGTQQQGDFDLRFIDMTLMHHQMGLKVNQLALQKTENAELKAKAKEMAEDQQRDIDRLNQMRGQLYPNAPKHDMGGMGMSGHDMGSMGGQGTSGQAGAEHQRGEAQGASGGHMGSGHMKKGGMSGMMDEMNRLQGLTGQAFDRAFAKDMIRHHEMQVRMSERAVKEAKHDEVRDFAQKSITDQKKDIADLQKFSGSASK